MTIGISVLVLALCLLCAILSVSLIRVSGYWSCEEDRRYTEMLSKNKEDK